MPAVLDKPRIQCRHHNSAGRQCPLDALENERCRKFHMPRCKRS